MKDRQRSPIMDPDIIYHYSAGAVVFRATPGRVEFLVLRQKSKLGDLQWVAPKGHVESEETHEQAAVREVAEEAGLRVSRKFGVIEDEEYSFVDGSGLRHKKTVRWHLFEVLPTSRVKLAKREGFLEARWLEARRAARLFSHSGFRKIFKRAALLAEDVICKRSS